ncbi:type IV secretion system protein [Luteimonas panaciterrae]|uniref:type IV secretion system protein n=1 Tax=Luteimonas panaciterrae TaxID=363885 RepID=UPI001CF96BAB|nr:type IV secretion system protein [Luteimonas panaciterrae]
MMDLQGIAVAVGLLDIWHWLSPKVISIGSFGDYVFFKFILDFLEDKIQDLTEGIVGRMMDLVAIIATAVLTIWIMFQGYRMVTGQMRESAVALVTNTARAVVIVGAAISFSLFNGSLTEFFTTDLKNEIHYVVTGESGGPEDKIDENLGWMQVAMTSLDMLDTVGDPGLSSEKDRAGLLIGIGSGGPAIVAGAMLLLYQVAMAMFIGFGPLFILCLLFDFTKSLFQRWLFYGIGTLFSMAMLSAMTSIALDMVTRVAAAMWGSAIAGNLLLGDNIVGGYNSQALQQGGMGMILTMLILTVPPMAANFFQGTLGSFLPYAQISGAAGAASITSRYSTTSQPGPQGQPPGSYQPSQPSGGTGQQTSTGNQTSGYGSQATNTYAASGGAGAGTGATAASSDQVKQGSQLAGRDMSTYSSTGTQLPQATPMAPELQHGPTSYGPGASSSTGGGGTLAGGPTGGGTPTSPGSPQAKPSGPPNRGDV